MKKLLTILCLVLLVSCSKEPPPEVPSHRLINKGGMTFEIGSNDPFTGVSIEYHENGQLKEKINHKDGKEVSTTEFYYHENGQLKERGYFKGGKEDGMWEGFEENGQIEFTSYYINGKKVKRKKYLKSK